MAKWIWQNLDAKRDEHVEFFANFSCVKTDKAVELWISADSDYGVYINGELIYHGQYPDYPHYKVYDKIDISKYVKEGNNTIAIEAWYFGESSLTYLKGDAGVWFFVGCGEDILCESSKEVLSRLSKVYHSWQCKNITSQIGYSYSYDATKEDGWKVNGGDDFLQSVEFDRNAPEISRPIHRLRTEKGIPGKIIKQEDGRILFDFGEEIVGIYRIKGYSFKEQNIKICWGEHIVDGWVRDRIEDRDFSIDYRAKVGDNDYVGYFRRLGLRYMEVRYEEELQDLQVEFLPKVYPLVEVPFTCNAESDEEGGTNIILADIYSFLRQYDFINLSAFDKLLT